MAITLTTLSVIVQFCAAFYALKLAWNSRRVMLLPLALAILLMAIRRALTLYSKLAFERPIDLAAETIALVISLLMMVGLVSLWRWFAEISQENSQEKVETKITAKATFQNNLPRMAIALGLISILGSCGTGFLAYRKSRDTILDAVLSNNRNLARVIEAHAEVVGDVKSPLENLKSVRSLWDRTVTENTNSHLCVIGANGEILLNTRQPKRVGTSVSEMQLEGRQAGEWLTVGELIAGQRDWNGFCTPTNQGRQVASIVYSKHLRWLFAIHIPTEEIEAEIRAETIPWANGFAVTSLLLLPMALGLLHWAYSSSLTTLRETERQFRDLIESAPDAMVIVESDGKIAMINTQTEQLFGYPREEILEKSVEILLPNPFRDKHRARRNRYFANPKTRLMGCGLEIYGLRKNGSEIPVEISLSPIETGNRRLVAATIRDITDREKVARALQARVRQQAVIAELGHDALAGENLDVLMQTTAERIAQTLDVEFCKVLQQCLEGDAMLLRAGVGWREGLVGEATVSTESDSQAGYTLQSSQPVIVENLETDPRFRGPPLLNEHGVISGVSVIIEGENGAWGVLGAHTATHRLFSTDDVSFLLSAANVLASAIARKRAEEQRELLIAELEDKNAELEQFTYTVSHDLKSPLVTIKGFLGVLRKDLQHGSEEIVRDDLNEIGGAADKMTQLLDELLELSRIGRIANPSEHVSLGEVVQDALHALAGLIAQRDVQVKVDDDFPVVLGDRVRLREVMQNLIGNAVKFSADADSQIEIGTRKEEGQAVCFVRDNGRGIDPLYHDKVFGLFEQLDAASAGTGIGLAIVKRIIEVHGGRIWIESTGAGDGADGCTVCFVLPWVAA